MKMFAFRKTPRRKVRGAFLSGNWNLLLRYQPVLMNRPSFTDWIDSCEREREQGLLFKQGFLAAQTRATYL